MKLIKFEKKDCQPCVQMGEYLDLKKANYEKVNPFDEPDAGPKYRVKSLPTLILFDNEGNEVSRTVGFKPLEIDQLILKTL